MQVLPSLFEFTSLRPGTMVTIPPGTSYHLPGLPSLSEQGTAWVTSSMPGLITLYQEMQLGLIKLTYDAELRQNSDGTATYSLEPSLAGKKLPTITTKFRIVEAENDLVRMKRIGATPWEETGILQVRTGNILLSDVRGPLGISSPRLELITQPSQIGYRLPNDQKRATWLERKHL